MKPISPHSENSTADISTSLSVVPPITHDLTEKELSCLEKLRQYLRDNNLVNPIFDDWLLTRFVRARKADYPKALKMFEAYLKFRSDNEVDKILDRNMCFVGSTYSTMGGGYWEIDKLGRPYLYMKTHGFDADIYDTISMADHIKYEIWQNEHLIHSTFPFLSRQLGKRIDKMVIIQDLKGMKLMKNFDSRVRNINAELTKIRQDYYPEILGKYVIINAPWVFSVFWPMVKVWMDKKTREKFAILGDNYKDALLDLVDKDRLADFLGGTLKNPMENTDSMLHPPWEEYQEHVRDQKSFFIKDNVVSDPWEASKGVDKLIDDTIAEIV